MCVCFHSPDAHRKRRQTDIMASVFCPERMAWLRRKRSYDDLNTKWLLLAALNVTHHCLIWAIIVHVLSADLSWTSHTVLITPVCAFWSRYCFPWGLLIDWLTDWLSLNSLGISGLFVPTAPSPFTARDTRTRQWNQTLSGGRQQCYQRELVGENDTGDRSGISSHP